MSARPRIKIGDPKRILSLLSANNGDGSFICNFGGGVVSRSRHIRFLIGACDGLVVKTKYFQFGQGMSMFESSGKVGALNLLINSLEPRWSVTIKKAYK